MTISTTEGLTLYTGNGSTTTFAIGFDFDADGDVKVDLIKISNNDVTTQVLNTDYTISGTNVIMTTAPTSSYKLRITYGLDFSQADNYTADTEFPAETIENSFDELSKQIKELKQILDYDVPRLPPNILNSTTVTDTNISGNYVFSLNSAGDSVELQEPTSILAINTLTSAGPTLTDEIVFNDGSDGDTPKRATLQVLKNLLTLGTVSYNLDDIDDVTITSVADNELLSYDSGTGEWINQTAAELGLPSQEQVEDWVGAMFTGNTETGIAATYQDGDGTIDLVVSDLTVAGDSGSTGMTPGDTLTIAGGTNVTTTMSGDTLTIDASGTDTFTSIEVDGAAQSTNAPTLDFDGTDFTLTESPTDSFDITINAERIQDIIGAMVTGNTETLIAVTYQDGDGTLDFVVDEASINHDSLTGFVANEHIDWTSTSSNFNTSGTVDTGALDVTGNITVSGTVDGRDVATDGAKLDNVEANADVTDATNVNAAGAVMNSDTSTASMSFVVDEDTMSSNSATKVPTQQSTKAYVDHRVKLGQTDVTCSSNTTYTQDIDTNHYFKLTFTSNCTLAFTFNTGEVASMALDLINAGAYTVTWPAALKWAGGSAPTFTSSGTDCLVVWNNGDDVVRAALIGQDFS